MVWQQTKNSFVRADELQTARSGPKQDENQN